MHWGHSSSNRSPSLVIWNIMFEWTKSKQDFILENYRTCCLSWKNPTDGHNRHLSVVLTFTFSLESSVLLYKSRWSGGRQRACWIFSLCCMFVLLQRLHNMLIAQQQSSYVFQQADPLGSQHITHGPWTDAPTLPHPMWIQPPVVVKEATAAGSVWSLWYSSVAWC